MAHTWTEVQPVGDADNYWISSAVSSDGSVFLAGTERTRLYISTNSGSTWSETRPAGDVDKYWSALSVAANASLIFACESRIHYSINSGSSWSEARPAGDINNGWRTISTSGGGELSLTGAYTSRLYLGTEAGGGATHEGEAALSSLSYLRTKKA